MEQQQQVKEAPKVTAAEVADWEENFRKSVSPLVQFDTQDNGHSMKFYNGESGVDAYWSGNIILKADNYIKWNFSMLNGVFIDSKLNLDETNSKMPSNLFEFFTAWQKEVATTITSPEEPALPMDNIDTTNTLAGPESNPANIPSANIAPTTGQLTENLILRAPIKKDRKTTIMDSAERMRRLAGL